MGGPGSLDPASSSNSPAVLPQACGQVLEYVAGARSVYDVQLKVCGLLPQLVLVLVLLAGGYQAMSDNALEVLLRLRLEFVASRQWEAAAQQGAAAFQLPRVSNPKQQLLCSKEATEPHNPTSHFPKCQPCLDCACRLLM